MTQIIHLNQKRKAKNRSDKAKKAAENRIKYGRTKSEREAVKREIQRDERHLDNHLLEPSREDD